MMKRTLLLAALLSTASSAFAGEPVRRYLVATRGEAREAASAIVRQDLPQRAFRDVVTFENVDGFAIDLTPEEARKLARSPRVRAVEPDYEVFALADSIQAGRQTTPYGVNMVNAPQVWPVARGLSLDPTKPVRIAVIDTGIAHTDPELQRAYKGGYDFINRDADPLDDEGHGTHVSGTVVAHDNNAGVVGVASDVELYVLKVLNECGRGSHSTTIGAVDWVIQKKREIGGNWIMSLSLGGSERTMLHEQAFKRAADAGILTFAAAGNDYTNNQVDGLAYPAAYSTVISVGAIDDQQQIATFSQRGPDLEIVAPGVRVLSTSVSASVKTERGKMYEATLAVAVNSDGKSLCLPQPDLSGPIVFAGFGGSLADFPAEVQGKIALIERGNNVRFVDKVKNAKAAGAIGVVLFNNVADPVTPNLGTLTSTSEVIPTVMISQADGAELKGAPQTVNFGFGLSGYALLNGTSMATPHASAVAALLWAIAPDATADQIRNAIVNTAKDLGPAGFDNTYGFGMIDALAAAKTLAPQRFGSGATPPLPPPPSGRRVLKRGG